MDISIEAALKIAEIISIIVGGGTVAYRLGRTTERMEQSMVLQNQQITTLQQDVKDLSKLMTEVALQKQRLDMHAAQIEELSELTRRRSTN